MSALAWATSWRAALRISRREVLRNKARNTLIVAMLALPVLGVTAIETVLNSAQDLSSQEQLTRVVGGTDAFVYPTLGDEIFQKPDVEAHYADPNTQPNPPVLSSAKLADTAAVSAALPNATLLPEDASYGIFVHGDSGYTFPGYYQLDFTDPALGGVFNVASGRVPHTATEVDLSPRAARDLGVGVGGTITIPAASMSDGKAATFTVVGLLQQPNAMTDTAVYALPSAPAAGNETRQGWFVIQHGGVSWSQVMQLNQGGFRVVSRDVVLAPPPKSQIPYYKYAGPEFVQSTSAAQVAVMTIAVGVALLEVVLLAGPAFAVSARRREREYAMLGAVGADASHLRRIVLADGVVLGAIAGVLGAAVGFGGGALALAVMAHYVGHLPGSVHVDVARVLGVALLSVVLGLCSALAPALSVAKRDIISALTGRRAVVARRVRVGRLVLGLVLVGVGVITEYKFGGRSYSGGGLQTVAGIAIVEVGAILCTPAIVRLVARCGRILPLGPRLALRDGARHSARTTPAVAAMFAAVAGAVAAGAWIQTGLADARAAYQPALLPNQVAVIGVNSAKQATEITAKLRAVLPISGSTLTQSVGYPGAATDWQLAFSTPGQDTASDCPEATDSGSTTICGQMSYGGGTTQQVVGGPSVFREVTGLDDAQAESVLARGGLVVFTPDIVQNGQVTLVLPSDGKYIKKTEQLTVPAVYVAAHGIPNPGYILSAKTATSLDIAGGTQVLLLDLSSHATVTQQFAANQVLDGFGIEAGLTVEDGFQSRYGLANLVVLIAAMFVAIGAAAIATGLALADGRADQETLVAVGGSPWTRRWLAGSTALVVTGLGVLIGVPVGFLIAEGLIRVSDLAGYIPTSASIMSTRSLTVPWLDLGVLALAVPLVTALGAMLLSRSQPHGRSGRRC
ncbi:MAG TPA: FtsX-like permease family protein [Actinospica sp.]|jgi:putative ABC transport system permease protein|nr:FtsX-like permease family protein [Actinospica sp.]